MPKFCFNTLSKEWIWSKELNSPLWIIKLVCECTYKIICKALCFIEWTQFLIQYTLSCNCHTWGVLNLGTIDIWNQIILCCWHCSMHYRMFKSIPDLYPLDANSIQPRHTTIENVSRHYQVSPGATVVPG